MCGIAGFINLDGRTADAAELQKMTNAIAHRGPDGAGTHCVGPFALGHRRLSILDLSGAAHQPMSFANGRYWIVYNGEVYNFLELRRELELKGYRFLSESDTEVILAGYDCWGEDCLKKFNGMWAFAIWDQTRRELFLSRDRFGVKPLFYFKTPTRFAFASEIKSLLTLADCPRRPNVSVVRDFLEKRSIDSHEVTIFESINRLASGHAITVRDGTLNTHQWWSTWENRVDVPHDPSRQVEEFTGLFEDACRIRLRSDVQIGSLLSGGLDSSAIVATIAQQMTHWSAAGALKRVTPSWHETFTAEYPGCRDDDGQFARQVIKKLDLNATFIEPSVENFWDRLCEIVKSQDTPAPPTMFSVYPVYEAVQAAGIKVTLDGQGSDEMLSGYHVWDSILHYSMRGRVREAWQAANCQANLNRTPLSTGAVLQKVFLEDIVVGQLRRTLKFRTRLRNMRGISVSGSSFGVPGPEIVNAPKTFIDSPRPRGSNLVDAELYRQFHETILPMILKTYDHAAMNYSVESRMPFLDWRLVCFVFSLPVEQKVAEGYSKAILRKAVHGIVPEQIRTRTRKVGFNLASELFNNQKVQGEVREIINDQTFSSLPYWDARMFQRWFEQRCNTPWSGQETEHLLYTLSVFAWHQMHIST